jgi:hypothetical protein
MSTREMVDSAFPLRAAPPGGWRDIILIYSGGDTVHAWTTAEILSMPARYRWPCWVRSNPSQVSAIADAANFVAWLRSHGVPKGTCVILDLETAVDGLYVDIFNTTLRTAGYKVTKYGSTSTIFRNPKTDGGTFVAEPGSNVLTTVGDTVARQWGFEGGYDLSIVKDQAAVPLWDTQQEADMPLTHADAATILNADGIIANPNGNPANPFWTSAQILEDTNQRIRALQGAVAAVFGQDDPAALAKAILAGLDPAAIAAATPAAIAAEVVAELETLHLGK